MSLELKAYRYTKGTDPALDAQFAASPLFSKVRPGTDTLFWKSGLRWYALPFSEVRRVFRRVEPVYGKLCCGGRSFLIERLVLLLTQGQELVIHIGDDVRREAEQLYAHLQTAQPQLQFGKE